jgi:threonine/homoserine/homoserine lactone efflux protein
VVVLLTQFMVERIRAQPSVSAFLQKLAGLCLLGFGLKMVLAK